MMPIMTKIYSIDEKVYYIYVPGTEHLSVDKFGNPTFKKDPWCYLDADFNKFVLNISNERADEYAKEQQKLGKNYISGPRSPETIDEKGDFVPNTNDESGIWERPTPEQIHTYRTILNKQEKKLVKELA